MLCYPTASTGSTTYYSIFTTWLWATVACSVVAPWFKSTENGWYLTPRVDAPVRTWRRSLSSLLPFRLMATRLGQQLWTSRRAWGTPGRGLVNSRHWRFFRRATRDWTHKLGTWKKSKSYRCRSWVLTLFWGTRMEKRIFSGAASTGGTTTMKTVSTWATLRTFQTVGTDCQQTSMQHLWGESQSYILRRLTFSKAIFPTPTLRGVYRKDSQFRRDGRECQEISAARTPLTLPYSWCIRRISLREIVFIAIPESAESWKASKQFAVSGLEWVGPLTVFFVGVIICGMFSRENNILGIIGRDNGVEDRRVLSSGADSAERLRFCFPKFHFRFLVCSQTNWEPTSFPRPPPWKGLGNEEGWWALNYCLWSNNRPWTKNCV